MGNQAKFPHLWWWSVGVNQLAVELSINQLCVIDRDSFLFVQHNKWGFWDEDKIVKMDLDHDYEK